MKPLYITQLLICTPVNVAAIGKKDKLVFSMITSFMLSAIRVSVLRKDIREFYISSASRAVIVTLKNCALIAVLDSIGALTRRLNTLPPSTFSKQAAVHVIVAPFPWNVVLKSGTDAWNNISPYW